ncbi:MAG: PRC-barrel domain-containing protein [Bryobacteraceae bacterium]
MLRTLESILGYRLVALNGEIGKVHDFYLDEEFWRLRYLVVETGSWLDRRRVLIAPAALGSIEGERREFAVHLNRDQVQSSPDVNTDQPVSRQQEMRTNAHYGWPAYWAPDAIMIPGPILTSGRVARASADPHLRSFREICSYTVDDGENAIAKVQDFVIDDSDWSVAMMIVAYGGWIDPRQVATPADRITNISWANRTITIRYSREQLEALPSFEAAAPVNKQERTVYFDYHGRIVASTDPPAQPHE